MDGLPWHLAQSTLLALALAIAWGGRGSVHTPLRTTLPWLATGLALSLLGMVSFLLTPATSFIPNVFSILTWSLLPVGFWSLRKNPRPSSGQEELARVQGENQALDLAVKKLQDGDEHYRSVFATMVEAAISSDDQGQVIFWNRGAEKIFGYTAHEMQGQNVLRLIPQEFQEAHRQGMASFNRTGQSRLAGRTVALTGLTKQGTLIPLEASLTSGLIGGTRFHTAVMRDVTQRNRIVQQEQRAHQSRVAISTLLQTSLTPLSLNQQLERALDLILFGSWLATKHQGGIFLVEGDALRLMVSRGFSPERQQTCGTIAMGHCLCGLAAQQGHLLFADHIDDRHHIRYADIQPHGHYCIPIVSQGVTLGVVTLYMPHGHAQDKEEEDFLQAMTDTLAGILERKRMDEALHHAKVAAEEASRAKSRFLANMSHEIRSPMNSIIGMTDLTLNTPLNQEQRQYLEIVLQSADALMFILNSILDFSKIEAGHLELEHTNFVLRHTFEQTCETLAVQAHRKNIELICDIAHDLPRYVQGDPLRLRQILVNLVANAIKFTNRGQVVVRVDFADNECPDKNTIILLFSVQDTGIGIPEDKIQSIFEEFSQADDTITRKFGGTGLGLTIARQLTELMGGKLWAKSQTGVGSTFYFTVRLGVCQEEDSQLVFTQEMRFPPLRAVVADANPLSRDGLTRTLSMCGTRITAVASGQQALDFMATVTDHPVDLLILDCWLPDLILLDAASFHARPGQKIILLLPTNIHHNEMPGCKNFKFDAALVKPVVLDHLMRTLNELFAPPLEPPPPLPAPEKIPAPAGLRILLAEDNPDNQRLVGDFLQKEGHHMLLAANGQEVIDILGRERVDLIVMDVQMPAPDGLQTTRAIRGGEVAGVWPAIPIIGLTAHAQQEMREACLAAGMDDFLTKPCKLKNLAKMVAHLRQKLTTQTPTPNVGRESPLFAPEQGDLQERTAFLAQAKESVSRFHLLLSAGNTIALEGMGQGLKERAGELGAVALKGEILRFLVAVRSDDRSKARDLLIHMKHLIGKMEKALARSHISEGEPS